MADGKKLQEENDLKANIKRKRKSIRCFEQKLTLTLSSSFLECYKYNGRATYIVNS